MTLSDSGAADAATADDLRADLDAAFDSLASAPEAPAGMGHNGGPEMQVEAQRTAAAPADEQSAKSETPEAEGTKDEARQSEGDSTTKGAPPEGWPSDANLAWDRLPKAAQDALRADLDAGRITIGKPAQGPTAPDPVREVVKAYEPEISRRGMAPEQAVKVLFEAQRALDENPVAALIQLARSYGVDPATLALTNGAQATQQIDPINRELQREIETLKTYLTQQQIDAFTSTKTTDGAPAYPHFEQVRHTMAGIFQGGLAGSLKDAYDMAVWARPDLRERILADQRKAEEAEARKAAEDARKRAVSIRSNPSITTSAAPAGTLRDELERNWSSASF